MRVAKWPASIPGMLCMANIESALNLLNNPSSIIAFAPKPFSSLGWKMKIARPLKSPASARYLAAPSSMLVCPSWPQACITPSYVDLWTHSPVSPSGSASMSARKAMLPSPLPRCRTPTTPVPPISSCTSRPKDLSSPATILAVRSS